MRKKILSMRCAGRALSSGNRVATVLPMPVGACASRQRRATRRAIDGLRQLALAVPEAGVRKGQRGQRLVELRAMNGLLPGPREIARAERLEVLAQRLARPALGQRELFAAGEFEVHQRDLDAGQRALLAQHPSVDARLRPVQRAMVGADGGELAAEGLDLFQPAARGVVAVGTATHLQPAEA